VSGVAAFPTRFARKPLCRGPSFDALDDVVQVDPGALRRRLWLDGLNDEPAQAVTIDPDTEPRPLFQALELVETGGEVEGALGLCREGGSREEKSDDRQPAYRAHWRSSLFRRGRR